MYYRDLKANCGEFLKKHALPQRIVTRSPPKKNLVREWRKTLL